MDTQAKQKRLEEFERLCQERGIPCTIQRRIILEVVLDSSDHPTANQVFEAVSTLNRGISRATIHRTLETLVSLGVITRTCHPGNVARYDACTEIHHHLVCLHCNKIIDVDDERLNAVSIPDTSAYEFEVTDFQVQLRGICKDCRKRKPKSKVDK